MHIWKHNSIKVSEEVMKSFMSDCINIYGRYYEEAIKRQMLKIHKGNDIHLPK